MRVQGLRARLLRVAGASARKQGGFARQCDVCPPQPPVSRLPRTATHAAAAPPQVQPLSDSASRTPGFSSIRDAIAAIGRGEFVLVLDDEDRENEGDLILAADKATPEKIAYMVEYTSGVICVALPPATCKRLELPLMVPTAENEEEMYTAFTVTVDLREGVTTGISASDRCKTIRALGNPDTRAAELRKPGHIFPLVARDRGVLTRPGHTEAAVDLAELAGVLCEVVDKSTGEMAKTDLLLQMAQEHGLHCVTIKDLIRHRVQHEPLVAAADAAGALSAGDLELKAVQCIDGSRAAYGVVGQLQDAASASLFFHEVPCSSSASWEEARECLQGNAALRQSAAVCLSASVPCIVVAVLSPLAGTDGTQGAALPGLTMAALLGALKAAGCPMHVTVTSLRVAEALRQFGYRVDVG